MARISRAKSSLARRKFSNSSSVLSLLLIKQAIVGLLSWVDRLIIQPLLSSEHFWHISASDPGSIVRECCVDLLTMLAPIFEQKKSRIKNSCLDICESVHNVWKLSHMLQILSVVHKDCILSWSLSDMLSYPWLSFPWPNEPGKMCHLQLRHAQPEAWVAAKVI